MNSKMDASSAGSSIHHVNINKQISLVGNLFYRSAYYVLLVSWIFCFLKPLLDAGQFVVMRLITSYITDMKNVGGHTTLKRHHIYPTLHDMEMREIAASFLLVTVVLRTSPCAFQQMLLQTNEGSISKQWSRSLQTTGPYLKKFRKSLRHLEDLRRNLTSEKGQITRRRKRVFTKYTIAEKILLGDMRSKEKLIGYMRTQLLCKSADLKEVTSLVKISRDKLEIQREENKYIMDQLERFTQVAQIRQ